MTNNRYPNPIQTQNIEAGDRIKKSGQSDDEIRTVSRIRMINEEKFRIDTREGDVTVAFAEDIWDLCE